MKDSTLPEPAPLKTIYRTIIRFEILSEEPVFDAGTLTEIDEQTTSTGNWIGQFLDREVSNQPLIGKDAVLATRGALSDPEFFQMDEAGRKVNEDAF